MSLPFHTVYDFTATGSAQKWRAVVIGTTGVGRKFKAEIDIDTSYPEQSRSSVSTWIDNVGFAPIVSQCGREVEASRAYHNMPPAERGKMVRNETADLWLNEHLFNLLDLGRNILA